MNKKENAFDNINKEKIIYFKYKKNIYIRLKIKIENNFFLLNIYSLIRDFL